MRNFFKKMKVKSTDPMFEGTKVLLFNLKVDAVISLELLCSGLGIEFVHIPKEDYLQPLGALAGIAGVERMDDVYREVGFSETMIVMKNFTGAAMNTFLDRMKRNPGIYDIDLKAIVTPNNLRWNALQLREELMEEKRKIQEMERKAEQEKKEEENEEGMEKAEEDDFAEEVEQQ